MFIPASYTSLAQPLNVFRFGQWKGAVKKVSKHYYLNREIHATLDLTTPSSWAKLHGLTGNQLEAPKYKAMIKHAWIQAGLLDAPKETFESFLEYAFNLPKGSGKCGTCFLCAYCPEGVAKLCFDHFLIEGHFHVESDQHVQLFP